MLKTLFLIGSGSFLGGVARYLTSRVVQNSFASAFPYGTMAVNLLGCLLIGLIFGVSERTNLINDEWRIFLTVGFCGGFTTFSTFANENMTLLRDGNFFYFALYTGLSVFLGLVAVFFGNALTKIF
ncbi:MAG TPA: fluoride efflux transporter CrcB [Prolixibacteraceae bacterium]|jgi:CrcB protein|nr:fluoride efflux transporter CrcB [Prolixibacteraceae bacterium]